MMKITKQKVTMMKIMSKIIPMKKNIMKKTLIIILQFSILKLNIVSIDGKKYYKLVTNQWNARIELNKKFDLSSYSTLNVEFMMELVTSLVLQMNYMKFQFLFKKKINWTAIDDVEIYIGKITATY